MDSYIVDRTPKGSVSITKKTRVTHLRYKGDIVSTKEGPLSEQTLKDLAGQYNAERKTPILHRPCFADIPGESARLKAMMEKMAPVNRIRGELVQSAPPPRTARPIHAPLSCL